MINLLYNGFLGTSRSFGFTTLHPGVGPSHPALRVAPVGNQPDGQAHDCSLRVACLLPLAQTEVDVLKTRNRV